MTISKLYCMTELGEILYLHAVGTRTAIHIPTYIINNKSSGQAASQSRSVIAVEQLCAQVISSETRLKTSVIRHTNANKHTPEQFIRTRSVATQQIVGYGAAGGKGWASRYPVYSQFSLIHQNSVRQLFNDLFYCCLLQI